MERSSLLSEQVGESTCDSDSSNIIEDNRRILRDVDGPDMESIQKKYSDLQETLMDENTKDEFHTLLLPSFVPDLKDVEVHVCTQNSVAREAVKISVQRYITELQQERNDALKSAQSYRNIVDDLQQKNRRLQCEMNNRCDTIRNFWRNNIGEGGTHGGKMVRASLCKTGTKTYN